MLKNISIKNILIIEKLDIDFSVGLNVLTGETGAGKSILLDSLGFVLGWRGPSDLVRRGAEQGEVTAFFELPRDHAAFTPLNEAGLSVGQDVILRRVNGKDGRKTAWINDRRVSTETLRVVSEHLLELHGQQDDRGLLDPKSHRQLLDQYGGHKNLLENARKTWRDWSHEKNAFKKETDVLNSLKEEESFLRHTIAELSSMQPKIGEEEALDKKRRQIKASEKLKANIDKAAQILGRDAVEGMMGDAMRWLESVAGELDGKLDAAVTSLSASFSSLHDAIFEIESFLEESESNSHDLIATEDRLFAIRGLARKHQVAPDKLSDLLENMMLRLEALEGASGNLLERRKALEVANIAYDISAKALSDARKSAGLSLDAAMAVELEPLKLGRALFKTNISQSDASENGVDLVRFLVETNPGTPAGPLGKIASGGELSRFLLALKVCLRASNDSRTVIFDEIDRGVGGATADAVGRRLAALAQGSQVLVVTHSPQVAAFASKHFRVDKKQSEVETLSNVIELNELARIDEIARMLSGDKITSEARAAAKALIKHNFSLRNV